MLLKRALASVAFISVLSVSQSSLAEEVPQAVIKLVPSLEAWGKNPVLVAAVKEQNARGRSLDEIKRLDKDWIDATGVTPEMQAIQSNVAAKELERLGSSAPYFAESFLMDDQGANVAMTNKTSDFWQGDEDKFTESFKGGEGAVHIGEVKFDSSAQVYEVQVSVPVMDGDKAIGALTIGIDLDALAESKN